MVKWKKTFLKVVDFVKKRDTIWEGEYCDLHTHSTYSDGTLSPTELIRLAEEIGLGAVALCDHNTVAGLPEFLAAGESSSVEAVPGVEFSTDYNGGELHILALFLKPECFPDVTEVTGEMLASKERSNLALVSALEKAGIRLDYEKIKAGTPGGQVNRAVIAAQMLRLGYVSSVSEAFRLWLSEKQGFYKSPKRLDALETIRFIRSLGAVPVLAHPFLNLDEQGLGSFLPMAVEAGLVGMEVYYPKFSREQTEKAGELADAFGLVKSGGSDFHGSIKPDIRLGTGRGDLAVPMEWLEKLRSKAVR